MDSAPEASTHEARSSPASPLTPKRIIRRLAVPKLSPCLELNALLDTQQADSDVQELEASTSLLAPAGNHIASAFHEAKNEAPTSRIPVGGGLADVIRRQALTPSKRQNQSSPGGRPKGKTGRLGKGGGRESFAAVKKLAGSLAKRASLSETADVESSEDGVGLKSRDGQRRISAYFTPSPKKRSSQDEETESPAKAVKGRALFEAEGQVAAAQGGQVAALKEGQVAEGDSLAVEALENHVDSLKDGIDGAECGERGEGQPQGSATIVTGRVACEEGGTFLDGVDSENAGDEGQEAGTVPLVGPSNGAQEPPRIDQATENGLRLSTGLEHCSHVHGSGIGAQESMRGPCSVFTAEGCSSPGASEVGVSSAMDTEVPVDGSTGPTCIGTGEPDSPMQEETLEEPEWAKHQKAPLQITVLGESAVDPLGSAQKEGLFSGLLASKALATGSHSPEQKPADSSADSIRANPSPMDTGLLTEPEIDTRVSLSNPNLVPKPLQKLLSQMTAAPEPPTPNLEVTLEEAPGLGRPTELTVDAIDEMCAALLADIEDLPTTVPFLKGSPEPFTRRSPESLLDGSPKPSRTADGDPPKPSEISPSHIVPSSLSLNSMIEVTVTEETVERAALENTPNQAGTMSLLAPTSTPVEVLITERTVEQTVSAVPSTSEADLAEAQWRRKLGERRRRGRMSVTDLCALEWCEMQVDFSTRVGKPAPTPAMQAGTVRHEQLEREVITWVEVPVATREDAWALKLLNMITGLRQLATEGMTRELYILGRMEGHWIVGIIDELRLVERDGGPRTLLCDTKTRRTLKPPSDAQKRTGMLQLMCYKLLFDGLLSTAPFPADAFFGHFALNARAPLSADVTEHAAAECALHVATLDDVLKGLVAECRDTPPADDTLLLRYEWQERRTVWAEDEFDFQDEWARERVAWHLDYWFGRRRPEVVPEDERWKCRFCAFRDACEVGRLVQSENEARRVVKE